jgi:hypothetical protein
VRDNLIVMWANHYGQSSREIEFLLGIVEIAILYLTIKQHKSKLMFAVSLVVYNVKLEGFQVLGGVNKQFLNTSSDSFGTVCEHLIMVV